MTTLLKFNYKKSYTILSVTLVLLLSMAGADTHDYYVSVTKIEHIEDQHTLQITSQIFIDDFEKLLQKRYDPSIVLTENEASDNADMYIEKYLTSKLDIEINGTSRVLNFIGKAYKNDILHCYIEVVELPEINSIRITNAILFDLYDAQQNIVRIIANGYNKGFMLNTHKRIAMLNFE